MARTKSVIHADLLGDKALLRAIRELGDKEVKKFNRSGVGKATTPVLKDIKSGAKKITYNGAPMHKAAQYAKSFKKRSKTYKRGHIAVVIIGARNERDADGTNWAPLSHLIEGGVRRHAIGKGSKLTREGKTSFAPEIQVGATHPGLPPKPVIRRAWDSNRARMLAIYKTTVRQKIDEFAHKANAASKREIASGRRKG